MRAKHSATVAHFRKLCCLGLPSQTVVPALLQVLHELIPAHTARFIWCDHRGEITGVYAENTDEYVIGERFFREYRGKVDKVWPQFALVARRGPGVGYTLPYQTAAFYGSNYYNLFERPVGVHHLLDAVIADERGPLGCVILTRSQGAKLFSSAEQALLASLIHYFAHALRTPGRADPPFAERIRSGLIVTDRRGRIRYADAEGTHLLMIASCGSPSRRLPTANACLPPVAMSVCEALMTIASTKVAPPPSKRELTPWGCFEYRASWLANQSGAGGPLVAINIDLRVPRKLALALKMRTLGLSARQQDVCQLLVDGLNKNAIARCLGVSVTTVVDHLDKVYLKLDVHDKTAAINRLLRQ